MENVNTRMTMDSDTRAWIQMPGLPELIATGFVERRLITINYRSF